MRSVLVVMVSFNSSPVLSCQNGQSRAVSRETAPHGLLDMKRPALPRSGAATGIPNSYPASQNFHQERLVPASGISDLESM